MNIRTLKIWLAMSIAAVLSPAALLAACMQDTITAAMHNLRDGITAQKCETSWFPPGDGGTGAVWDLSNLQNLGVFGVQYVQVGDTVSAVGRGTIDRYVVRGDSIEHLEYQTPVFSTVYVNPLLRRVYPMAFGLQFEDLFESRGMYANSNATASSGQVYCEADGSGSLVTAAGDTLRGVLRMHTLRTSVSAMSNDTLIRDTTQMFLEISESYEWFVASLPFPVAETHTVTYYRDGTPFAASGAGYTCFPDGSVMANEAPVGDWQDDGGKLENTCVDGVGSFGNVKCLQGVSVTMSDGTVHVSFPHEVSAHALLCDFSGVVYRRVAAACFSNLQINCCGIQPGNYILYVNANGESYSEKIRL